MSNNNKNKKKSETKKRRWKPGTVSLREIRKEQQKTNLILPHAPFDRLVREITQDFHEDLRFEKNAIEALQEAAEDYLIRLFADSQIVAIHAGREAIKSKDMNLVLHLRKNATKC